MKAVRFENYGGAEVLKFEDAPKPNIEKDEVLIKVTATAFNPVDANIRSGKFSKVAPLQFPFIPNSDVSGIVEETGSEVKEFRKGDKVFGFLDMFKNGAAAEYVAAKASSIALAPNKLSLTLAAGVPLVSLTAWQGLFDHGKLKAGNKILITAAAGSVGNLAVQYAKNIGAYVIATASGKSKDFLTKLGVDEFIDYQKTEVKDYLKDKVDFIFNAAPLLPEEINLLLGFVKPGGYFISILTPVDADIAKQKNVSALRMMVANNGEELKQIANLIDKGKLTTFVTDTVPLKQLAEVHKNYEEHKIRRKIIVTVE